MHNSNTLVNFHAFSYFYHQQVIPSHIMRIENNKVVFGNNTEKEFDAIVFATGYRSIANKWLKVRIG